MLGSERKLRFRITSLWSIFLILSWNPLELITVSNTMNLVRVLLSSLSKSSYKKLGETINDFLLEKNDNFPHSHFFLAALDIVSSHVWKPPPVIKQKSVSKFRLNVNFCNKGIDFINLSKILNTPELVQLLPPSFNKETPMVVYNLEKSIRSKIFNYKEVVQETDIDSFLEDPSLLPCSCAGSSFIDTHHGHIITGDLRIVENNKLRKLLTKGPKFRESAGICWNKAKQSIVDGLNESIKKWVDTNAIPSSLFTEWKCKVLECVENKIDTLKTRILPRNVTRTLSDLDVQNNLEELQSRYVMVPIDKADSNIAFVCKRYYIKVLLKELALQGGNNITYEYLPNTNRNKLFIIM